jgi:hypothetical protein
MSTDDDEDAAPLDAVPASFAVTIAPRDRAEVGRHTFESLKNEKVVVRANGFIYRGLLVGADEGELYLRGEMRWWVLPLAHVTDVAKDDARDTPLGGPERWEPKDAGDVKDEDE